VFCGLIGAFIQGGAIGRLVRKYGEPKLIGASLLLTGVSLAWLPFIKGGGQLSWSALFQDGGGSWLQLLLVLALLSVGTNLTRPPVFGLLSNLTPAHEQGATIGVAQSAGSLARIIGPLFAATLYGHVPPLPYLVCGVISIVAALLAIQRLGGKEATPAGDPPGKGG
jgi:MFS family permease